MKIQPDLFQTSSSAGRLTLHGPPPPRTLFTLPILSGLVYPLQAASPRAGRRQAPEGIGGLDKGKASVFISLVRALPRLSSGEWPRPSV